MSHLEVNHSSGVKYLQYLKFSNVMSQHDVVFNSLPRVAKTLVSEGTNPLTLMTFLISFGTNFVIRQGLDTPLDFDTLSGLYPIQCVVNSISLQVRF